MERAWTGATLTGRILRMISGTAHVPRRLPLSPTARLATPHWYRRSVSAVDVPLVICVSRGPLGGAIAERNVQRQTIAHQCRGDLGCPDNATLCPISLHPAQADFFKSYNGMSFSCLG